MQGWEQDQLEKIWAINLINLPEIENASFGRLADLQFLPFESFIFFQAPAFFA
jgi:hypothetical protein